MLYEGYGPGGVAILAEALTDNRNRTAGEVRMIFDKHNGALAGTNAVARMFLKQGVINIEKAKVDEDKLMELALEAGAEDIVTSEEGYEVTTSFQAFEKVRQTLLAAKIELAHAEAMMIPTQTVSVTGEIAEKIQKIVEGLEANDDVQEVYTNAE